MSRKWLRNNSLFYFLLLGSLSYSQSDTLDEFVKVEVLTDLQSFSSLNLSDSSSFLGLNDLLESSSPVYLKNYGKGQLATLSIRGNGASQTQLFWNGFKMNSPTLGQTDLSLIPSFFVSDIKLNYSGASSVDGSGGIGGSLKLSNRLNWKKGVHGSIGKEYASFSNSTSTLGISFGSDKFYNQVKILSQKGENDFEYLDISRKGNPLASQTNNRLSQFGAQYEMGYQLNTKNLIQSTILFFDSWRQLPPIIGGITNNELQEDQHWRSFVSWKSFQDKFSTDLRASYFKEQLDYTDSISSIFSEVDVDTYQAQFRAQFSILKSIDVETSIQHSTSLAESTGFEEKVKRDESGVYGKLSETRRKIYYEVFARQELVDEDFSPLVAGGGVVFQPIKDQLKLKGNIANNYRVPTLNDLYWAEGGNKELLPERGWSTEVGIEVNKEQNEHELTVNVTGFYSQTENWIQWVPTDAGYWSPINVKKIENKGIEAIVNYLYINPKYTLKASSGYTYTQSRNKEFSIQHDERANRVPIYLPAHKANTGISLIFTNLSIHYTQIYNGRVFIDESNSTYLPHYFPANTGLSYRIKYKATQLEFGFKINNLYNEPYQVVANRPIPGRNYSFQLNFKF